MDDSNGTESEKKVQTVERLVEDGPNVDVELTLPERERAGPPSVPERVAASDGEYLEKVRILWDAASGAASYEVYRAESADGEKSLLGTATEALYDDAPAEQGTTYWYWVKAKNEDGDSDFSDVDEGHRASTQEEVLLKRLEQRLGSILMTVRRSAPRVGKIAVESSNPTMNMLFLDLAKVCYITSESDAERDEIMFVCEGNERYYNNKSLIDIETMLGNGNNPWFLRTAKSFIINLGRVKASKVGDARTIWFEGLEKPLERAVSDTYLDEYKAHVGI